MRTKFLLGALTAGLIFSSCSNDFDVTEEWKETMVIVGLLNQSDSVQYIKINKAYLGEGDALVMGGVYDSINYANSLTVVLNEITNNVVTNSFTLVRDTGTVKPAGIFAYPNQVLYKTSAVLNENKEYELVVTNNESQSIARARTRLVRNFLVIQPTGTQTINFTNPNFPFRIQWNSAVDGRLYNLRIRFYYYEQNKITLAVTDKYLDWYFTDRRASTLAGGEPMEINFPGEQFYQFVQSRLDPNDSVWRHPGKSANVNQMLDFVLTVAGEEFATYMEVAAPSTTILQEKPIYTNIEGGIGIFSSRYTQKSAALYGKKMTDPSVDSLYAGQYTYDLGFCSPVSTSPYFCQ
ncbi:MAG: hypothetical protein AB1458_11275 [Bacteroidota bacterium]